MNGLRRGAVAAALAASAVLVLAGCVDPAPHSSSLPTDIPTALPTSTSTTRAPLVYLPKGTAADNLAYFKLVGHTLLNHDQNASGKTIIDWFVAHGFDKKQMQVTPDRTSIGLAAWNIEFSVKINNGCIIGQAGNTRFQSFAAPVLATGKCLIGKTRTINW